MRPAPTVGACLVNPACATPLIVAHRGEGAGEPENSLAAIERAGALGADVVEIDVRQSADGVFLLMHDSDIARTTIKPPGFPATDKVSELAWSALQTLALVDLQGRCTLENAGQDPDRCRVALFADALDRARGKTLVMVDWKGGDETAVGALISAHGAQDHVLFFDASLDSLSEARAAAPGLVVMPRAHDAAEARALLASERPQALHVDPPYLAEIEAEARAAGAKLFADGWAVDIYLAAGTPELATAELFKMLDDGADLVELNSLVPAVELRDRWVLGLR